MILGVEVSSIDRPRPFLEASHIPIEVMDYFRFLFHGKQEHTTYYDYKMEIAYRLAAAGWTKSVRIAPLMGYSGKEEHLTDTARLKWIRYQALPR